MPITGESYTQEQIDDCLTALIAFAGNASAAHRYLKAEGKRTPGYAALLNWRRTKYWERFEELREKLGDQLEKTAANNMREIMALSQEATRMALEAEIKRLEDGKEDDPARAAANMARVSQSSVDKLMTLTNRPTQIVENRDVGEILRSLQARGVVTLPEEPAELEAGSDAGLDS